MSDSEPTPVPPPHVRGMRAYVLQIVFGVIALGCFIAAIITAGMVLLSGILLLVGVLALVALALTLIQRVSAWGAVQRMRERRRNRSD